jgi:hypothetical protein
MTNEAVNLEYFSAFLENDEMLDYFVGEMIFMGNFFSVIPCLVEFYFVALKVYFKTGN